MNLPSFSFGFLCLLLTPTKGFFSLFVCVGVCVYECEWRRLNPAISISWPVWHTTLNIQEGVYRNVREMQSFQQLFRQCAFHQENAHAKFPKATSSSMMTMMMMVSDVDFAMQEVSFMLHRVWKSDFRVKHRSLLQKKKNSCRDITNVVCKNKSTNFQSSLSIVFCRSLHLFCSVLFFISSWSYGNITADEVFF